MIRSILLAVPVSAQEGESLARFEGTFGSGDPINGEIVSFVERDGDLLMFPALWSGPLVLRPVTPDSFVAIPRARRRVAFQRANDGRIVGARIHGLSEDSSFVRLDTG